MLITDVLISVYIPVLKKYVSLIDLPIVIYRYSGNQSTGVANIASRL